MTPFILRFAPQAARQIESLDPVMKGRVATALESIASDPVIGKPLQGPLKGLRSHRFGDYRVVYQVFASNRRIDVLKVMHRRDVYR